MSPHREPERSPFPWEKSLADRLQLLRPGTLRVGYFYEVPDSGTFRYRAYNMAQTINTRSRRFSASYFFLSDLPLVDNFPDYVDIFVLVRFRFGGGIGRLIDQAQSKGKKVIFDMDDLLFSASHTSTVASTLNFGLEPGLVLDNWYALASRLGHTLSLCDGALTTTPTLAHHIEKEAGIMAAVIPNFLNEEQLAISAHLSENPPPRPIDTFNIGYFSGSKSHARDFAVVAPALASVLSARKDMKLTIAGILDLPDVLKPLENQIERLPFMDYVSLQSAVARVDLNIVPLQENVFTDSKSELKYFESAAVGTPTVASPTEVYRRIISDGKNGWLAPAGEWANILLTISSLGSRSLNRVASQAKKHALETYTGKKILPTLEKVLGEFAP